jgi:hypothetical protein
MLAAARRRLLSGGTVFDFMPCRFTFVAVQVEARSTSPCALCGTESGQKKINKVA